MKTLYLLRHAKSSWDDSSMADIDRPLNDRGEKDAPSMGKRFKKRGILPDLMISSPAVRAQETCRIVAHVMGYPEKKIKIEKEVYMADEDQLLSVLKSCAAHGEPGSIMLVGHNPGITYFANRLLDDSIENIPTCGIVACELDIKSWKEIRWACGEREFFDSPKHAQS